MHSVQHPLALGLLSVRGGGGDGVGVGVGTSSTSMIIDYTTAAANYFNNLRVPAAVLGSLIMKEMFVLQTTPPSSFTKWDTEHNVNYSKSWRALRYSYLLLMVLAFALEINTIFVATQVSTQLATDGQRSSSTSISSSCSSLVGFLIRDYEFEYTTVRCHFVTGLLSFTIAQGLRVRYALRKYTLLSMSGMCLLFTTASGMLTYTNANTISYGGFSSLLQRNLILSYKFFKSNWNNGPMSAITVTFLIITLLCAVWGWCSPEFQHVEKELK